MIPIRGTPINKNILEQSSLVLEATSTLSKLSVREIINLPNKTNTKYKNI